MPILDNNNQTNIDGLYTAGDLATKGGGSIAIALNHAYHIIKQIQNRY